MKKTIDRSIVWLLSIFLLACGSQDPAATSEQQTAQQLDEFMRTVTDLGRFSGSILVARDGQLLLSRGYGLADLEHDVPSTPATKFRIGSITKQFTAMAILILQERGALSVRDPICRYVANCPEAWQEITIHHLLTNTSGIPNFENFPDNERFERLPATVESTVERFKDKPLEFDPGENFLYSSSGWVLLGHIIEKVSGKRYENFLKEQIFDPLDMYNTGYDHPETVLKHRAKGYGRQGTRFINAVHFEMDTPHAAGALYSTVEDLYLWDQALYTGQLVSQKSLKAMFTPFKSGYGYGWHLGELFDHKIITHAGAISGFRAVISRFPEEKASVIVLSNFEHANVQSIGDSLAAIVLGEDYEIPQVPATIQLDPTQLQQCEGTYRFNDDWEIVIKEEGGRLFYYPWSDSRSYFELHAETENRFFVREMESSFALVRGDDGRITQLVTSRGDRLEKTERASSSANP